MGWEGERVEIDRRSRVEWGESGDRQKEEWVGDGESGDRSGVGGGRVGIDRSRVEEGESGDRQEWGGRGREWG